MKTLSRLLLWMVLWTAATLAAQAYPTKPIRIIVPYPPAGSADYVVRAIMREMQRELGQPLVIENRPGGGTNLGAELVAKAAPDGYTLLLGNTSSHGINRVLFGKLSFDPDKDFIPISRLGISPMIVGVGAGTGIRSLGELIAKAKSQPGVLNFASSGNGSPNHLAGVLFNNLTGGQLVHIPYKGGAPSALALVSGEAQVIFGTPSVVLPHIHSGRIVALSTTTPQPSPVLPGVPGAGQAGLPGFDVISWHGLFAPAGTAPQIIAKLHRAVLAVMGKADVRKRLAAGGLDGEPSSSPEAFAAYIKAQAPMWEKLVRQSGARVE